ncbi:MAG: hypothetical protein GX992_07650 [Clostridium sp.]|nr:hypothetical protein [Clostridium sp.]
MMYTSIALIGIISCFEIKKMVSKGQRKEIAIFSLLAISALLLSVFYLSNPHRSSLSEHLLSFIGRES